MGVLSVIFWPLVRFNTGVELGACAKMISVGTIVGEMVEVDEDCNNVMVGDSVSAGDEEAASDGDGDRVTVGDGDKATVGLTVGDGDRIAFGLGIDVGKTAIVGLIDASLRTELFRFIKIKTKITTIIVNKEIINKTNLE